MVPSYRDLLNSGELKNRVVEAFEHLSNCDVCAHQCSIDRLSGKIGICRTGQRALISSYGAHFGEESPLRGTHGSGTIFFTSCNLRCQYCQNHDISQTIAGKEVGAQDLAYMMLELQEQGCHNINFVSPSHVVPQIIAATLVAAQAGLNIPLVYNTGGYDSLEMLNLLDGVIDIYMPDMKYSDSTNGKKYSKIPDYWEVNQTVVREMHRQVGDLSINSLGIATRGLLIRHLILPNDLGGSKEIIRFLSSEISKNTYLNLMDQYRPTYLAYKYPELNRVITSNEYKSAIRWALDAGMRRLDNRADRIQ
jgi:putative pyruvate formate lyase activating enzyme